MAKVSENKIPNLTADWAHDETNGLPYAGWAVLEFIKTYCQKSSNNEATKIGALYFDTLQMKMYSFRTEEDKEEFISTGDISLILSSLDIVFSGTQRKLTITNKMGSNNLYFTTNSKLAEITVGFESKEKDFTASEWTDVIEDAYFTVSVDKGATGEYLKILDNVLVRYGETLTFDIYNYIASGSNRVKVTAIGTVSEQTASLGYTVTLTSMYLTPSNFGWYLPFIEGTTYNVGGMNIGGSLLKKLIVKISNGSGYSAQYEDNIGTATYVTNPYYFTKLEFPTGGTGIYNLDIWLDADGLLSDHLIYNIMCVAADDKNTAKLCCISDVAEEVINYSDNTLFNMALYNGGAITASPHIKLTSIINTNPTILIDEDLVGVETSKSIPYKYNLEIESEETNIKLDAVLTFGSEQKSVFRVDNSASYPPTSSSIFYLNSAIRNNSQENKTTIVNEANKQDIEAEWTNMSWVDGTDGWTIDDAGRKCLFLPARTKVNISYTPLSTLGTGRTIEFTFKVSNASDYDENVISICDSPDSELFRGIRIRPNNILVHSRDLNTDNENQSYDIPEDTLINVCISIIRNYKTNYGNICIVYVNGVRKKEFSFTNADSWITDANIIMGSDTSDLYLYNMRVYNKGFGTQDALQNYIASLPNSVDKKKAYELIHSVIDDSFNVTYDRAKASANVVTIEMLNDAELPHYGLSKEYSAQCNLSVFWNEHPEWNWWIENIKIEGQGTTSMNYFRWNLRWRLDKSKGFTVHLPDGLTSTEDTLWFDGEDNHVKLSRMTAKINYASSMQSHKIGATAMFNDIHHHLGLDNEAGGRVAVFQYPFYFFEKKKIEGTSDLYTYTFIGLFTFGADKGDKYTFGYKNPEVKDTLLSLEGTDHSIKGVGMDYPWTELKYVADEESICVDKGNSNYDAAWEVSESGSAESEEEIQEKLDLEFKPAYEVAYNNSTMIIGTDESLETINADVDAWGQRKDDEGNAYQRYEFWIDGEYELYYLSKKTNQYVKNGVNLLTLLGLSTEDLLSLDIKGKNELFKLKRREKFKSEMLNYWHLDDCLYCYCFLLLVGATDNFKKNSYPYKMGTLASGSRWRWRLDDLDTLFDIDNQGLAVKGYSIEAHDWTDSSKTAYVFKGEDSVFWTLIGECFEVEIKAMGKSILGAMYELSTTGTSTIDKLMGFVQSYFWNKAQNYFTKSAYNSDAEYKYEEAWPKYASGEYDVDVHPLAQSLGDHLEAEMLWVRQRLIYMMSKWGYGPFSLYTDTCLGRINFRTLLALSFTLTPFMDLYPTILSGQGAIHTTPDRILSGEEAQISGAGGTNTNVYIMAADELESLGDLSTLTVDAASNAAISIASKRLKTIKVGDEVAEKVTSNLQLLSIGLCNSLVSIDARNLKSLTGTVDLSRCPRIVEANFEGTDVRAVTIGNGSKIEKLYLSDATTILELLNLNKLSLLTANDLSKIEFFRVENCPQVGPFDKLKEIYNLDSSPLKDIRIIGFDYLGESADIDMLANFAEDKDKEGNPHSYNGIDASGTPQEELLPVIEGSITIDGNAYLDSVDTVKGYFPNVNLTVNGSLYIRFKDAEVNRIIAENVGDGVGTTLELVEECTRMPSFRDNKTIVEFEEFEKFIKLSNLSNYTFMNCTNLTKVTLPDSLVELGVSAFGNDSKLELDLTDKLSNINTIASRAFTNCTGVYGELNFPNLNSIGFSAFDNSGINTIANLGKITQIPRNTFYNCKNLTSVVLPDTLTEIGPSPGAYGVFQGCDNLVFDASNLPLSITSIEYAFNNCSGVTGEVNLPNLLSIGVGAFNGTNITKVTNLGNITSVLGFLNCTSLTSVIFPETVTSIADNAFNGCTSLTIELSLPTSITTIGNSAFNNSGITKITSLGSITNINNNAFQNCRSLKTVVIHEQVISIGAESFRGCNNLTLADIPSTITSINNYAFRDIPTFTFICRATVPPTLGDAVFNSPTIYVPDDSVEAYKVATNWSEFASLIHPLSDYVEE